MEQQRKLRGKWSKEEDDKLCQAVMNAKGKQTWCSIARNAGLNRSANSCSQRWRNYLKLGCRPGKLTDEEKLLIVEFRSLFQKNCWAKIRPHLLPGRRDIDIRNFWHPMAKRAKRENCDVDIEAVKAELVEKITAAGKFSKDYFSLITKDGYAILCTLLPNLAVAGGSAVTAAAASSSTTADMGGAGALISAYSADVGPTMEVRYEFPNPFWGSQKFPENVIVQRQTMGTDEARRNGLLQWSLDDYGYQGTDPGLNQGAVASLGASNDTGNPYSHPELDGAIDQCGPASREAT